VTRYAPNETHRPPRTTPSVTPVPVRAMRTRMGAEEQGRDAACVPQVQEPVLGQAAEELDLAFLRQEAVRETPEDVASVDASIAVGAERNSCLHAPDPVSPLVEYGL